MTWSGVGHVALDERAATDLGQDGVGLLFWWPRSMITTLDPASARARTVASLRPEAPP